jgi:hypothetical protein
VPELKRTAETYPVAAGKKEKSSKDKETSREG